MATDLPSPPSVVHSFAPAEAAKLSGLTSAMLNYLCRHHIVVPMGRRPSGRGRPRAYTYSDVVLLRALKKLLDTGVSALRLRRSLSALQKRSPAGLAVEQFLVTDGYNVYLPRSGVVEEVESGQLAFAFVLMLQPLRDEINGLLQERKVA